MTAVAVIGAAYVVLLYFPQPLFAYSMEHGSFQVYAREPIDPEIGRVLDSAEERLRRSPIYDDDVSRHIYLTNGHKMYAFLSHKAYGSFAHSLPMVQNVFINRTDVPADRVFITREKNNSRSLSGVIAHEITHLFIHRRYGRLRSSFLLPTWKNEGYCEYIAGESTITLEEGIRLWRENPSDDMSYRYSKYHAMVKHLIENEKMSVDELFNNDLNEDEVASRTFAALP